MNRARLLRELPLGAAIFIASTALAWLFWRYQSNQRNGEPPTAGETRSGEAARSVHPKLPADQLKLPPERVRYLEQQRRGNQ